MNFAELREKTERHFRASLEEGKRHRSAKGPYSKREKDGLKEAIELRGMPNVDYWRLLGKANATNEIDRFCDAIGISNKHEPKDLWMILDEIRKVQKAIAEAILEHGQSLESYDFTAPLSPSDSPVRAVPEVTCGATITEAVEAYFDEHNRTASWGEATFLKRRAALDTLKEFVGPDTPIGQISKKDAAEIKQMLLALPVNRTKLPQTRGLHVREAIKVQGVPKLNPETINGYLSALKNFWKWAEAHGHASEILFDNMRVAKSKKNAGKQRTAFAPEALTAVYRELTDPNSKLVRKESHRWATLIAIFTGARQNEVCQLELSDIRQQDGIWLFDLTDDGDGNKRLKNSSSRRRVPVHSELIGLGLLDFVAKRKQHGHTRLFPDYDYRPKSGYGAKLSVWFNRTLTIGLGIKSKAHVFHGLRHSFITRLGQAGAELSHIQSVVGHDRPGVTQQVYMQEGYTLQQLKDAVEKFEVVPHR